MDNIPLTQRATDTMPLSDFLGATQPHLTLYLPHQPNRLEHFIVNPSAQELVAANSNHWRKIVTLLAKVVSPDAGDWRDFRENKLFRYTALCFTPSLANTTQWHWIGGKDNLQRFVTLQHQAHPLAECPEVSIDPEMRLLLTPYPDYRQLSNEVVSHIRASLDSLGFYCNMAP